MRLFQCERIPLKNKSLSHTLYPSIFISLVLTMANEMRYIYINIRKPSTITANAKQSPPLLTNWSNHFLCIKKLTTLTCTVQLVC